MHKVGGGAWAVVVAVALLVGCSTSHSTSGGSGGASEFRCPDAAPPGGGPAVGPSAGDKLVVATDKLVVATTVAPLTSIVANVAGDRAEVHGVVPEGTDSHTYEPKPSVAELFSRAHVVFVNGLSLDDTTADLARDNAGPGAQIVALGPMTLRPDQYIFDFSFPREGGRPNPHLWTNPPMARCYAVLAAAVLAGADPANAEYYRGNAEAFAAKVDDLDRRFQAASDTVAPRDRALLTYHDAFAYFAAHYKWRVIGAVQVSSFDDPTPKEVVGLIEQVKQEGVPAIFGSEVFPSPVLARIGEEAGVTYVAELRDDDLPGDPGDPDHSYLGLMKADFVTMVSALGGDPSSLVSFDPSDVVPDTASYAQ